MSFITYSALNSDGLEEGQMHPGSIVHGYSRVYCSVLHPTCSYGKVSEVSCTACAKKFHSVHILDNTDILGSPKELALQSL